jgi:hypothetical protein
MYRYLEIKTTPGGKSFLESIYHMKSADSAKLVFEELKEKGKAKGDFDLEYRDWKIDLSFDDGYLIMAQISEDDMSSQLIKIGTAVGAAIGLTVLTAATFGGSAVGAVIVGTTFKAATGTALIYSGYVFLFDKEDKDYKWYPPQIFPHHPGALKEIGCYFEFIP